jgi:hypothetical protein
VKVRSIDPSPGWSTTWFQQIVDRRHSDHAPLKEGSMTSPSIAAAQRSGHSTNHEASGSISIEPALARLLRVLLPAQALSWDRRSQRSRVVYRSAAECDALRLWLYSTIGQLEQLRDQLLETE